MPDICPMLTYVLIAAAVQGVILALVLFRNRENRLANRLLAMLIVVLSVQMILVANDRPEFFRTYPHLLHVGWLLPTLYGPLIFLSVQKLTSVEPQLRWKDALYLLPFLFCFFILLPFFLQSAAEKQAYLADEERFAQDDFGWLNQLVNVLHLVFLLASFQLLRQHERRVKANFSAIEQIRLKWLRDFLLFILLILCVSIPVFYARKWGIPVLSAVYPWHYLLVAIMIYWMGYRSLSQKAIFSTKTESIPAEEIVEAAVEPTSVKYQKNALPEEKSDAYLAELLSAMQEKQLYLQNDLSIQKLSELTNIPRHHLSQVINERLGKNFYDFVNGYRVEAAMKMLTDERYSHLTTLAVAEEAGFNSKATFNAVFKKMTGLTPSEYTRKQEILG